MSISTPLLIKKRPPESFPDPLETSSGQILITPDPSIDLLTPRLIFSGSIEATKGSIEGSGDQSRGRGDQSRGRGDQSRGRKDQSRGRRDQSRGQKINRGSKPINRASKRSTGPPRTASRSRVRFARVTRSLNDASNSDPHAPRST